MKIEILIEMDGDKMSVIELPVDHESAVGFGKSIQSAFKRFSDSLVEKYGNDKILKK